MSSSDNNFPMLDLYCIEADTHTKTLNEALLALEQAPDNEDEINRAMRAAHSIKGAARMVNIEPAVKVAHTLEDCFVAAQEKKIQLNTETLDSLLKGVDFLQTTASLTPESAADWIASNQIKSDELAEIFGIIASGSVNSATTPSEVVTENPASSGKTEEATDTEVEHIELGDASMVDLFRIEVENHGKTLSESLLELESNPLSSSQYEPLMRAAHSIKGAARMINMTPAVNLAHVMEDSFVAAQEGKINIDTDSADILLKATDWLNEIAAQDAGSINDWYKQKASNLQKLIEQIRKITAGKPAVMPDIVNTAETQAPQELTTGQTSNNIEIPEVTLDFSADPQMLELFKVEVETHGRSISELLLELEQDPANQGKLEPLMRAAHSVKGAARMVNIEPVVKMAHAMEDSFVAAQEGKLVLNSEQMDALLKGMDLIQRIANADPDKAAEWFQSIYAEYETALRQVLQILHGENQSFPADTKTEEESQPEPAATPSLAAESTAPKQKKRQDTAIRVSANSLNRLLGLAGESLVESRWIRPFTESIQTLKRHETEIITTLDSLREAVSGLEIPAHIVELINSAKHKATAAREEITERLTDLEDFDRRATNLSDRLNREVIASRMRPFSDGVHGFRRMVRDVARSLNKEVMLDIKGLNTQVDRDILEQIEAPLNHLLRNTVDHGIEMPDVREEAGKPRQATITLEAAHVSGMLSITVKDDGRGIDTENIRQKVIARKLANEEMTSNMSESELLEFLFLPSFSTRDQVTEISGRGVGLDVVHSVVQEMRGTVRIHSKVGKGTKFHMQLPLTLSVVRSLMVEISGESYAFPLARVEHTMKLNRDNIEIMEGRQYFTMGNQHIGILSAHQVLKLENAPPETDELSVVIIGERYQSYALVVDRFVGEKELVVHALDPRLGKVKDIASASILDDGTPTLIIDVEDMIRSIDILIAGGRLDKVRKQLSGELTGGAKRVLVVDDSITVREVERNMLESRGYYVEVAVDGMDGWNAVRTSKYDLVISDIDMPRMNGFEFVSLIKQDQKLKETPVMIVSYKDREEDRIRGLEVGADYYLTKGSFQDDTLLDAVIDLIGQA